MLLRLGFELGSAADGQSCAQVFAVAADETLMALALPSSFCAAPPVAPSR